MAEIELVIKIPEEEYEMIVNSEDCGLHTLTKCRRKAPCFSNYVVAGSKNPLPLGMGSVKRAVARGTMLPKGHGRIADVDKMLDEMRATRTYDVLFALERVKPIIEADKGD